MKFEWSEFNKPSLWAAIAIPVFAGIITFFGTLEGVKTRIEDLGKSQDRIDDRIQRSLESLQSRMDERYDQETQAERRQDASFQSSITELKTDVMLLLCGPTKRSLRGCTVKSLVAQARSVSKSQAEVLQSATVQLTRGDQPQVASEVVKEELPQVTWGSSGVTKFPLHYDPNAKVSDVLLWSAAAQSAHWTAENDNVKASFVNGYATFKVAPNTSKEHVTKLLESLNTTTEVLKASESSAPAKK